MNAGDFRQYVFRTPEQWQYGLAFRLRPAAAAGFELFAAPAFQEWITQADVARSVVSLGVSDTGVAFWLGRNDGCLYRRDPINGLVERVIALGTTSEDSPTDFGRVLLASGRIWIHDRANRRLLALRGDTFQIIAEISVPEGVDVTLAGSRLFVLEPAAIRSYDVEFGRPLGTFAITPAIVPIAIAADPRGAALFVIARDAGEFLRFSADGRCRGELGRLRDVSPIFEPRYLTVDSEGNLFVSDGGARVHQFAADGGYVGGSSALGPIAAVTALAVGGDGRLYVGDSEGIGRLGRDGGTAGQPGQFFSGALENTTSDRLWHRVDVVVDLDAAGAVDVYYATSDDPEVARRVREILDTSGAAADRAAAIDRVLQWRGPHQLRAANARRPTDRSAARTLATPPTHSVLFDRQPGRYLWLKVVLSALAPRGAASVKELRVYYPRLSYLRYLPAVYQEDKASREFLERYLSIFETVLSGLETTIDRTPELFDPTRTPPEFLDWLGQWLDLAVEEDWPAEVKRKLIARASRLYARKGTPAGLADFIQIITGERPLIRESFAAEQPFTLGAGNTLGIGPRLAAQPVQQRPPHEYTRLGDGAVLGAAPLRSDIIKPIDPFLASAHQFTVVLNLSPGKRRRYARGLLRVIREQSPADAAFDLRVTDSAGLGDAVVGVNWRVADPQPLHLGYSTLGRSLCRRNVSYGPELGVDATLVRGTDRARHESAIGSGE